MRYAAAAYNVMLATEQTPSEARAAEHARLLQLAREASPSRSLRRRAGEAVIAFGVRLASERRPIRNERRLATRAS